MSDPRNEEPGVYRVVRGGGWFFDAAAARSACRHFLAPDQPNGQYGFRVAAD